MSNCNLILNECKEKFKGSVASVENYHPGSFDLESDFSILNEALKCSSVDTDEIIELAYSLVDYLTDRKEFVIPWLEAVREDTSYLPPCRGYQKGAVSSLTLFNHKKLQITLNCFDANLLENEQDAILVFPGQTIITKFIKSGDCKIGMWRCSEAGAQHCQDAGSLKVHDGQILVQDGNIETFAFESASNSIVVIQAVVLPDENALVREYDKSSCTLIEQCHGSLNSSRVLMYSTLLRLLGRADSFSLLQKYLSHPDAQVRWHIMRELIALDTNESLTALEKMASLDPSDLVRNAAEETWQLINCSFA